MKPGVTDYLKVIENDKGIAENLVPFDEIIAEPVGSAMKGFAMIKGENITELYDIIRERPNCHFRFCAEDFVKSVTKEEFNNMKYSAIIRKSRHDTDFAVSELIGSRICELFDIDCPYVSPLGNTNTIVASLDFLKHGQKMETYAEYTGVKFDRKATAVDWAKSFKDALDKDSEHQLTEDKKKFLIKELIKQYIVRRFLLKDNDFNCGNLAIITEGNEISHLVSFDFEYCLNNYILFDYSSTVPINFMEINIKELSKKFPDEFGIVVNELKLTPEKYDAIKLVFSSFMDNSVADFWAYSLKQNLGRIESIYNQYSQDKEML